MNEHLLPSQYIELSHPRRLGPLFDQARAHLAECQECRAAWIQGEALKALALESGPPVERRLSRAALMAARRAGVEDALRELPGGGEDPARELLLRRPALRRAMSPWIPALGALAMALGLYLSLRAPAPSAAPAPQAQPAPEAENLPFEFDPKTPPAAVESPGEDALDQEARQMLIAHLSGENRYEGATAPAAKAPTATPRPSATPSPLPTFTPRPTLAPTQAPTPVPTFTPWPTPKPTQPAPAAAAPTRAPTLMTTPEFSLEQPSFQPGSGLQAVFRLGFPDEGSLEIRVFDGAGRSVRLLADGRFAAGPVVLSFDGKDDAGKPLPPGPYYARIMTRWYSRVEALELQP